MKTHIFQRDSVQIAYDDSGLGERPLVFLHRLGGERHAREKPLRRDLIAHVKAMIEWFWKSLARTT